MPSSSSVVMRIALMLCVAAAHTRLECPPPRSADTGAKKGPCDAPDDLAQEPYAMHPGLNTITWLESLGHPGAPGRLALSMDGSDDGFETCILLDHIPHDEHSNPGGPGKQATYHRSTVTVWLPDIKCERCNLQLITYMTDDIHGVKEGAKCVSPAAKDAGTVDTTLPKCNVVYHSCAPISIDGTTLRKDHACDLAEHNEQLGWPFQDPATAAGATETATSTYYYKGDAGLYSQDTNRLQSSGSPIDDCPTLQNMFYCDPTLHYKKVFDVPDDAKYASLAGTCAAVVDMEVAEFVLGEVPSKRKTAPPTAAPPTATPTATPPTAARPTTAPLDELTETWVHDHDEDHDATTAPVAATAFSTAGEGAVPTFFTPLLALLAASRVAF